MSQVAGRHAFDVSNYYALFTKEEQRAPIRKSFLRVFKASYFIENMETRIFTLLCIKQRMVKS